MDTIKIKTKTILTAKPAKKTQRTQSFELDKMPQNPLPLYQEGVRGCVVFFCPEIR
jgi:hypothetical protein